MIDEEWHTYDEFDTLIDENPEVIKRVKKGRAEGFLEELTQGPV